jgi:chaperonin cofactor prefoldin
MSNKSQGEKKNTLSGSVSGTKKTKGNGQSNQEDQKFDHFIYGTEIVNNSFGQRYEEMVNRMFKEKLLQVCKGYYKSNLQLQRIHDSNRMFSNWALIQKTPKTQDDLPKKEPKQDNTEPEQQKVEIISGPQRDEFVRNIEIDGAAYVSATKDGREEFSIELEGQTLAFKAPCIILVEISILSSVEIMIKKLKQLIKDYVFLKSDPILLNKLISDDKETQNEDQMLEADKIFFSIHPSNLSNPTKIYLVCVTNNNKKEGMDNFNTAWDWMNQAFDLGLIDCLFNKKECQPLNVDQFRKDHVKQVHIQSTPYSNFLSQVNELPDKIDRMEKNIETLNVKIETLEDRIGTLEDRMGKMEDRMGKMEDRMGKMEDRLMAKIEEEISKITSILNKFTSSFSKQEEKQSDQGSIPKL